MPDIVIVFFALGIVAGVAKSDLKVPKAAYDTLSILLMLTLGLKGGLALHGHLTWSLLPELIAVAALGLAIPFVLYPLLRYWVNLNPANSASLAAHYGSVSAGTFAVALAYAESHGLPMLPQTTLYLVLLELPALVVALVIYRQTTHSHAPLSGILHEALTSRGVVLLSGGVLIGAIYGYEGSASVAPLFLGAFKALLALFLLDMGLCASKYLWPIPWQHWRVVAFALVAPFVLAFVGVAMSYWLQLPSGSALILTTLIASASYIAAPAAVRSSIPDADVGLAVLASLGITFPLNTLIAIPIYHEILQRILLTTTA